jgi:aerobic-type carbon monoxide dehydrogenase small subunit (CoxS/CutS family)
VFQNEVCARGRQVSTTRHLAASAAPALENQAAPHYGRGMSTTTTVRAVINGAPRQLQVSARTTLADALREQARLTGTHLACEQGVCGACTVIVDELAVRSCLMLAVQAEGASIVTVEGLTPSDGLSGLQAAFRKHHALQCGFCTPGILTTMHALLCEEPDADEDRIREVLGGNLCRCTGYIPIVEAVLEARASYRSQP